MQMPLLKKLELKYENLKAQFPKGQASGEDITINDSSNLEFDKFKILGNIYQETEYIPVDYIESDGNCYLDTEYQPNNTTKVICKGSLLEGSLFSCGVNGVYTVIGLNSYNNVYTSNFLINYNSSITITSNISSGEEVHNFEISQTDGFFIDNENIGTFNSYQFTSTANIYIFAFNNQNLDVTNLGKGKLYSLKIYDNDLLVRDFVPCYRNSDNKVGLYDLVNKKFYENKGTGNLTYGQELPKKYPSIEFPSKIKSCGDNGNINISNYNKNILKFDDVSHYGITYHDTNKITIKNPTQYCYAVTNFTKIQNLVKGKTVTISIIANGKIENNDAVVYISTKKGGQNIAKSYTQGQNYNNDIWTKIYTFTEDDYFTLFNVYVYSTSIGELELEVQIEIGDKVTDIVTHEEQIISFPTKEGQSLLKGDYLADDGIHTKWEKKIFNGTEAWKGGSSAPNQNETIRFALDYNSGLTSPTSLNIMCENLRTDTPSHIWNIDAEAIGQTTADIVMRLNKERCSNVEELKVYLAQNPITVYLERKEVVIPYTPEQRKAYNQIENAKTYKGITHIFSKDEVSPIFEVEYSKDLEIILTK